MLGLAGSLRMQLGLKKAFLVALGVLSREEAQRASWCWRLGGGGQAGGGEEEISCEAPWRNVWLAPGQHSNTDLSRKGARC